MKHKAIVLIISILSLCLGACQSETQPPTVKPIELTAVLNETAEAPLAATSDVVDEIIDETQQTFGATATLPPPPPPIITPTPGNNNEAPGSDVDGGNGSSGGEGGANETQTFSNVNINSGAYEGAILESQFASGGGGGSFGSCITSGGMQTLPNDMTFETIDQMISIGCTLIDGLPIVVIGVSDGNPRVGHVIKPGGAQWADQFGKFVAWGFNPHENIRIVFYEQEDETAGNSILVGWKDVQVNSDGYLLLRPEFPSGVPLELLLFAAQRSNGQWIVPALYTRGFWEEYDDDQDGLSDYYEPIYYLTDPDNPDSDFDGLLDGEEVKTYSTDPLNPDTDGDGRLDGEEVFTYNTDPNVPDSEEVTLDSDDDGLSDEEEVAIYGSDPQNRDSDGDGRSDGDEVVFGTDPLTTMNADGISVVGLTNGVVLQQDYSTELGWIETTSNGDFFYQEDRRGPWGIFLYDDSRDLNVHLDFWTKEMSCNGTVCGTVEWVSQ